MIKIWIYKDHIEAIKRSPWWAAHIETLNFDYARIHQLLYVLGLETLALKTVRSLRCEEFLEYRYVAVVNKKRIYKSLFFVFEEVIKPEVIKNESE